VDGQEGFRTASGEGEPEGDVSLVTLVSLYDPKPEGVNEESVVRKRLEQTHETSETHVATASCH
jgi:hypothetical protein